MTTTPSERQRILVQLHTLAVEDVVKLWRAASAMDLESQAFRRLIEQAYPEIPSKWGTAASEFAALWYDDAAPNLTYRATPAPLPPVERYTDNARWALGAIGEKALDRLVSDLQLSLFDMARETIVGNVRMEPGSTWARYASATACAFCRVMATRGAVYSTEAAAVTVGAERWEWWRNYQGRKRGGRIGRRGRVRGKQAAGDTYHPSCRCIAVEVRPGGSYEPPSYVSQWEKDYVAASRAVAPGAGAGDLNSIVAHMRANSNATK
ncbi:MULTISPECIES: hypothetical protein [Rhodococcus]|uniref:VG15 protein n=1 Tax=Rhodococcus TaxID=1827 RepID=UPI001E43116B|nr:MULTISPECIES: hypothetical protein [Rhodococcus]BDB58978.1 hypothetical protein RDE2_07720 [Rhodococcus sp. RDE2]